MLANSVLTGLHLADLTIDKLNADRVFITYADPITATRAVRVRLPKHLMSVTLFPAAWANFH